MTGLSTSTVYLLLAIRLGTSAHARPARDRTKSSFTEELYPLSATRQLSNPRERLDDVDEVYMHLRITSWKRSEGIIRKSHATLARLFAAIRLSNAKNRSDLNPPVEDPRTPQPLFAYGI